MHLRKYWPFDDKQIQIMRMKNTKLKESLYINHALAMTKSKVLEHYCSTNNFTILLSSLYIKLVLSSFFHQHFWFVVRWLYDFRKVVIFYALLYAPWHKIVWPCHKKVQFAISDNSSLFHPTQCMSCSLQCTRKLTTLE